MACTRGNLKCRQKRRSQHINEGVVFDVRWSRRPYLSKGVLEELAHAPGVVLDLLRAGSNGLLHAGGTVLAPSDVSAEVVRDLVDEVLVLV